MSLTFFSQHEWQLSGVISVTLYNKLTLSKLSLPHCTLNWHCPN